MTETFDAGWLALREGFDAAARSAALADLFIDAMPDNPHIMDLGAGTGSLFRWLAPRIAGPQVWTLVDADAGLLTAALATIAEWAVAEGIDIEAADTTSLVLRDFDDEWRVSTLCRDLAAAPAGLPLDRIDGLACSALLDLVSQAWLARVAGAIEVPFLACLSVDGRDAWRPPLIGDLAVRAGFRRDQTRPKGFGHALGPHAPAGFAQAFAGAGFTVLRAPSDWSIGPRDLEMMVNMVESHAEVAARRLPAQRGRIAAWERVRLRQLMRQGASLRVGHTDLLALPRR